MKRLDDARALAPVANKVRRPKIGFGMSAALAEGHNMIKNERAGIDATCLNDYLFAKMANKTVEFENSGQINALHRGPALSRFVGTHVAAVLQRPHFGVVGSPLASPLVLRLPAFFGLIPKPFSRDGLFSGRVRSTVFLQVLRVRIPPFLVVRQLAYAAAAEASVLRVLAQREVLKRLGFPTIGTRLFFRHEPYIVPVGSVG